MSHNILMKKVKAEWKSNGNLYRDGDINQAINYTVT